MRERMMIIAFCFLFGGFLLQTRAQPICSPDIVTIDPPDVAYLFLGRTLVVTCTVLSTGYTVNVSYTADAITYHTEPGHVDQGVQLVSKINEVPENVNGTKVYCSVYQNAIPGTSHSGISNTPTCITKSTHIYVQGQPEPVDNLVAVQQAQCSMLIQWDPPPYLLPGLIVDYFIVINEVLVNQGQHSTHLTYSTTNPGIYSIIVIAYNGTEPGKIVVGKYAYLQYEHKDLELKVAYDSINTVVQGSTYVYKFTIKNSDMCSFPIASIAIQSCDSCGVCYMASTSHDSVTYTVGTELTELYAHLILTAGKHYNTTVALHYNSGHTATSFNIATSTRNIQNASISGLCLRLVVLERDYMHLYLKHGTQYQLIGPLVVATPNDTFCIDTETMVPGHWTLYCYDGLLPMDSDSCNSEPALVTNITVPQHDEETSTILPSDVSVILTSSLMQSQLIESLSTDFQWSPISTSLSTFSSLVSEAEEEEESTSAPAIDLVTSYSTCTYYITITPDASIDSTFTTSVQSAKAAMTTNEIVIASCVLGLVLVALLVATVWMAVLYCRQRNTTIFRTHTVHNFVVPATNPQDVELEMHREQSRDDRQYENEDTQPQQYENVDVQSRIVDCTAYGVVTRRQ